MERRSVPQFEDSCGPCRKRPLVSLVADWSISLQARDSEESRRVGTIDEQSRSGSMSNPKTDIADNTQKDPDEWVSGDEPMTGAQASYLKTLSERANEPDMFEDGLTKAEASKRIDELRKKVNIGTA